MRRLYQQNEFPIFQNCVYGSREEAIHCPKGTIDLVEDDKTGLIYNRAFNPTLAVYDRNYNNEQAHSTQFRVHLDEVAQLVVDSLGTKNLIEVGCGKGFFLEMLLSHGVDITGFDPTYEGSNPCIVKKYFSPELIKPAKGLILRHVLEHISAPVDFLNQLRQANGGVGLIYIEVPCFDWICKRKAWFDIFYEHVNYFRLSDFQRMFNGVIDSGRFFGGQYLYIVADLTALKQPQADPTDSVNFPSDFIRSAVDRHPAHHEHSAIWGAASKGVIFSLLKQRSGQPVSLAIDINPAKHGKFLPATGVKVVSPASAIQMIPPGASIYVMNSNYIDEIRTLTHNQFELSEIDHE